LERAGLVTRTRQATDERVVQVDLTAQGRAQLSEMRQRQREAVARLLAVLDPQEQATLQRLLARVLAAGRQGAGGPSCCTSALHQKELSASS
jgi:DNA-binding MarR family transcriptional regulator